MHSRQSRPLPPFASNVPRLLCVDSLPARTLFSLLDLGLTISAHIVYLGLETPPHSIVVVSPRMSVHRFCHDFPVDCSCDAGGFSQRPQSRDSLSSGKYVCCNEINLVDPRTLSGSSSLTSLKYLFRNIFLSPHCKVVYYFQYFLHLIK